MTGVKGLVSSSDTESGSLITSSVGVVMAESIVGGGLVGGS